MRIKNLLRFLIFIAIILLWTSNVYAASQATLSVGSATEGGSFTVALNLPAGAVGIDADVKVTYADGTSETKPIMYFKSNETTMGSNSTSFSAKVAGNTTINATNIKILDINSNPVNR